MPKKNKLKSTSLNTSLIYTSFLILLINTFKINAQQITTDTSQTLQQLVENNLVLGCVQVSNISSPFNGNVNGFSSFGYFERGTSNFPFENGLILSSGNVNSSGNTLNTEPLNEGASNWETDQDLETALGISNTLNATTIQFSFISASSNVQFNYILASEEYFSNFPCNYSDGFAFLIRETGSGNAFENIAVIQGTTTPVNTSTVHDEIVGFCDAENDVFFEGYNVGDTNFNGRTTVMSASTSITPNIEYEIKLIIADQTDARFDSAVFIEGNSFTDSVNLGDDYSTCDNSSILNATTNNPDAVYTWYQDNVIINNQTASTLLINASANYRVEIAVPLNNTTCIFEDAINVTLNSIQTVNPLNDFILCDDISNDGSENFDLTTLNTDFNAILPPSNYTISYHLTNQNAITNSNGFNTINTFQNPQTIFIRGLDNNSGCVYIGSVNLVVNPLPTITNPEPITLCSNNSSNFNLTSLDSGITNNNSNLAVSYHFSQTDAEAFANPIMSPYEPINTTEELFIRIININTNCTTFSNVTINTYNAPNVDTNTQQIDTCNPNGSGFEVFNLESVINNVLQAETNITVSYHVTLNDANNDENAISNTTTFENTVPDFQTVYIRIENNDNTCFEIVPIELHTNILETGTQIVNFAQCDTAPNDGISSFDLAAIAITITNNLPNVTVTFYETEENLNANTNALDDNIPYSVNTEQTLYILIENTNCVNTGNILLSVLPAVTILNEAPVNYCDTNFDSLASIQLTTYNNLLSTGIPNATVAYFETEQDAINNTNQLPEFYENTANPLVLYVKVTGENGCFDIKPLEIEVLPAPATTLASNFILCDDDQDGFLEIDLTIKETEITSDSNTIFSYFLTENDANSSVNQITNPSNYNTATNTIVVKVENNTTGCYALVTLEIIVNTLPVFTNITPLIQCESDGNQIADFILAEKDIEILNNQTGKVVFYYETEADALSGASPPINKNAIYNNTSQVQTLYIRVENETDTTCFGTSFFNIEVGSNPIYNQPTDFYVCDDRSNDGFATFNLNEKITEITAGSPENLDVTFYLTIEDAENQTGAISGNITTTVNPQTIFISVDNGTYCKGISSYEYGVIQVPQVNLAPELYRCDVNLDGFTTFNLTEVEIEVLDARQNNISIVYFENETDLNSSNNPIQNPENYINTANPQTVYIAVTNLDNDNNPICEIALPIVLNVNLPPVINNINTYQTCINNSNSFNLNETITALIGSQNAILNFYSSQSDAITNANALSSNYTYISNNDTLFVRAEFADTNCFNTSQFTLQVNALPIANTLQNLEACDDNFDGLLTFNLLQQTAIVLGSQNQNNFSVNYYTSESNAITHTDAIQNLNYEAQNNQEFFIRIENNTTNCFTTTSFSTIVRRKPLVNIPDQVICLDNLPLTVNANTNINTDSYLWSTGETTPSIEINEIGNYSVTVRSRFNCTTISNFSITESESAVIEFTESIDFGNPNNLTITLSGIGDYLFQFNDGEPQESNFFANVPIGPSTITVIDLNGCNTTTKEIIIIDAPQYFTPNGDAINETWHITGVELLEGTIIYIYNRYGKLITILKHNSNGWDGKYNGKNLPATDYWFVADVKKGLIEFQVKGHFALRR